MSRYVIATVDEFPRVAQAGHGPGSADRASSTSRGEFFGIFNVCPHQGGSLCEGALMGLTMSDEPGTYTLTRKGEMLRCPWHGWEFDVRTGQSWCDPDKIRTRSYASRPSPARSS